MKILYLLRSFPRVSLKFILDEMLAMEMHGVLVEVISLVTERNDVVHHGAEHFKVHYIADQQEIAAFVRDNGIDHIHAHFAHDATDMAYKVHQQTGVSFSFTTHAFDLYKVPHVDLQKWSAAARRVLTISEYNKRFMRDVLDIDNVWVSRCGVFPEKLTEDAYSNQPFKIITACRNVEKKGLGILIEACRELRRRGVDFECEVMTDGLESDEVTVVPPMAHPAIADFLRSGSVFVLPCVKAENGDQDGIPVTLMEAMALRIPVVSTSISGIPELITNRENGMLVSPGSVGELVDAIIEIKDDVALVNRIRRCSRERVLQSYNIRSNAAMMLAQLALNHPALADFDLPPVCFCQDNEWPVATFAKHTFNPSFHVSDDLRILAYRVPSGDGRLVSYVSVNGKVTNISNYALEMGCLQLIDPKVFALDDGYYVTFNSGHVNTGNDIFVMKVYPELGKPKRVVYEGRQQQERNWAFFQRDGEVYALYWLNPLKVLRLKTKAADVWEFEDFSDMTDITDITDMTIGTQLAEHEGRYYFMAHMKYFANGKKLYLGRACRLDFDARRVEYGNWFVHSYDSLFGCSLKHNSRLFSCTYFSGIQVIDGEVVLGYGVNDVDYNFSRHSIAGLGLSMAEIFDEVYKEKMWGGPCAPEFYSGRGTNDYNTELYREYVQQFIKEHEIKSVVDIGCGDFRLGRKMDWSGVEYTGIDVVKGVIENNNRLFSKEGVSFRCSDITTDELPDADLCLIRQVFQHFSNEAILAVLPKLKKYRFVLVTDGMPPESPDIRNINKPTSRYNRMSANSGLYLESPPFDVNIEVVLSYLSRNGTEVFRTVRM